MSIAVIADAHIDGPGGEPGPLIEQLRRAGYAGPIAAIARYEDEREALVAAGIDRVFNFYAEVGSGFAEDSLSLLGDRAPASAS